jgi:hypothetical protein
MTLLLSSTLILFFGIALFVVTFYFLKQKVKPVDKWNLNVKIPPVFSDLDKTIKNLSKNDSLSMNDYEMLFEYFVLGIDSYASKNRGRITYPGVSGTRGSIVEGLEGFSRSSILICSWIKSGRGIVVNLEGNSQVNLKDHFFRGLMAGTKKTSSEYWGDISDYDQRIVESADLAISIWMLKDYLKKELSKEDIEAILTWLDQVNGKKIYDGNWILFRIISNMVLTDFGFKSYQKHIKDDYEKFKSFYVGDGWFTDGKGGPVDYYNVWQMQYMLFWISEIDPNFDAIFLNSAMQLFSKKYKYMISPKGIPMFGRSCCYRLAASVPLVVMAIKNPSEWSGTARRATDVTWLHFISRGALKDGTVTQGYWGQDEDLLENYSGRASPLWSLRSLVLAFYLDIDHSFWKDDVDLLPIETESYEIDILGPGLKIIGVKNTQEILVQRHSPNPLSSFYINPKFKRMTKWRKIMQKLLKRPLRHSNVESKYGKNIYSSKSLFMNDAK